jgi:hypothetical protein
LSDIGDLNEKLAEVIRRLNELEAIMTETRKYPEIASLMRDLKIGARLYDEPLKLIQRLVEVRRFVESDEEGRDEITREILNSLAVKGSMNVSEITRELREIRGKASRVTVKKRLDELTQKKIISKGPSGGYELSK